jgi:hypothetical protein
VFRSCKRSLNIESARRSLTAERTTQLPNFKPEKQMHVEEATSAARMNPDACRARPFQALDEHFDVCFFNIYRDAMREFHVPEHLAQPSNTEGMH